LEGPVEVCWFGFVMAKYCPAHEVNPAKSTLIAINSVANKLIVEAKELKEFFS
jgi:hypothetical protein